MATFSAMGEWVGGEGATPSPSEARVLLLVEAPECGWAGEGRKALVAEPSQEHEFSHEGHTKHGVFSHVRVGQESEACEFIVRREEGGGALGAGRIYRASDPRMWLEIDHDRRDVGTAVLLWGCVENPEWVKPYIFHADGSISPARDPNGLCIGVQYAEEGRSQLLLVPRDDPRRLVLCAGGGEVVGGGGGGLVERLKQEAANLQAGRQAMEAHALALLSPGLCSMLRKDGSVVLPSFIPPHLVRRARGEINRRLGRGEFNARAMASDPSISALIRDSALPCVLNALLGGGAEWYRSHCEWAQISLRSPGDMCPDGEGWAAGGGLSPEHWSRMVRGWHIDGCACDESKGETDHYGTIRSFSLLVGVLLADIAQPMSGELVLLPGSHQRLADYFSADEERIEQLRTNGAASLPNGEQTDSLFAPGVKHFTGRAGDVILSNFMTAHLVAPNTSPDIRYAVYFRFSCPALEQRKEQQPGSVRSMLQPWCDWEGLNRIAPAPDA